jgi:hypothetical protein
VKRLLVACLLAAAGAPLQALPTIHTPQVRSVETWAETYGRHVGWVLAMQAACGSSDALKAMALNRSQLVRAEIERGATYAAGHEFAVGMAAGRSRQRQDLAGVDEEAKKSACARFGRIESRFIATGEVFRWKR